MTLTTAEAAWVLGVGPGTVRQWVLRGKLKPVRAGARPLQFHAGDVERLLEESIAAEREGRPPEWEARHTAASTAFHQACES